MQAWGVGLGAGLGCRLGCRLGVKAWGADGCSPTIQLQDIQLCCSLPVDFQNGAVVVQVHGSFGAPVKDVASQDALYEGGEPGPGGHLI